MLSIGIFGVFPGCSHLGSRKSDDKLMADQLLADMENGKTMLVGDYTTIGNYHTVEIRGVGFVQGLPGTGADDVNSLERQLVYDQMTKLGVPNVRALLADPSTAVVNVLGYLRPGVQEGDRFDVEVMLPAESGGKSLRGGWLMKAPLQEMRILGGDLREGDPLAYVEGPIIVADPLATETNNPSGLKKGTILGAARVKKPRQIYLHLKSGYESAFITDRIAKEINRRFYVSAGQKKGMATAKSDSLIVLDVHPTYQNDVSRYVKIIQSIACYESSQQQLRRIQRLKEELREPAKAQRASFQLEAIGKPGVEALKNVLDSRNTEILFHAGTSLVYLGDGSAARILTDIARDEPAFRVYALGALSALRNDIEAEICLQELLHVPSAETRYGAFRALWYRNPYDRTIRGENLGGQFSYHGINSPASPMVHLTKSKRPEVVLFGNDIRLTRPFALDAGPMIFVNGQAGEQVVVTKFGRLDEKRQVSDRLDDIIRAVVDLGGTYPDVFQMLCQADQAKVLSCRLAIDCLPEANRVYVRPGGNDDGDDDEYTGPPKRSAWEKLNPKTWFEPNPGAKTSDHYEPTNMSERE